MNAIKSDMEELIKKELAYANLKFPLFRSPHEGYAVIKEELEEVQQEEVELEAMVGQLWHNVKTNVNGKLMDYTIERVYYAALKLAIESAQVAAMALKYNQKPTEEVRDDRAYTAKTKPTGCCASECSRTE